MREDLLHFVWIHRVLPAAGMRTTAGTNLKILKPGEHNNHSGPDFFNARLEIGGQLWAGNVEIHVKASDWYLHGHEMDPGYDNVILHVVWESDVPVFRRDRTAVPALELRHLVPDNMLRTYRRLLHSKRLKFINCERQFGEIGDFHMSHWLERLYFERLEQKATAVEEMLHRSRNDWEQVFFSMLLQNFGLNINGIPFAGLAEAVPFSVVRKLGASRQKLECLLFGMAGFLGDSEFPDAYYQELRREYQYLAGRFSLKPKKIPKPEFARLRPANFPTIRLSQFAGLYASRPNLFARAMEAGTPREMYALFASSAATYWDAHYTFGQPTGKRRKALSHGFIDLLLINTVMPVRFCYARHNGKDEHNVLVSLLSAMAPERNQIISRFCALRLPCSNAMETQGLLQLYREYCVRNRCLYCAIGSRILSGK